MALIIKHVYPPIPLRQFDWAVYDEEELCCAERGLLTGYGPTELEAILDWLEQRGART